MRLVSGQKQLTAFRVVGIVRRRPRLHGLSHASSGPQPTFTIMCASPGIARATCAPDSHPGSGGLWRGVAGAVARRREGEKVSVEKVAVEKVAVEKVEIGEIALSLDMKDSIVRH